MQLMNWNRLKRSLPRPSLGWMSISDIVYLRNRLLALYLNPGEKLSVNNPDNWVSCPTQIEIFFHGSTPVFRFNRFWIDKEGTIQSRVMTAWLKLQGANVPNWHLQELDGPIEAVPFNSKEVKPLVKLLRQFKKYFPFTPTNNFLLNNGEVIV